MKKNTYIFCLVLSTFLWAIASIYFIRSERAITPEALVQKIQDDVYQQEAAIQSLMSNKSLMKHLWENRLTESEFRDLARRKFTIHLYEKGRLTFWNRNDFPSTEIKFFPQLTGMREGDNVFLYQSFGKAEYPEKRINVIIPVYRHYDVSNQYLISGFTASDALPETSEVSLTSFSGGTEILSSIKKPLFYVSVKAGDIQALKPDLYLILLIIASLIVTIFTIQLSGIFLSKTYSPGTGIIFVATVIVLTRLLIYFFGLPFHLENLELFSPQIFASNNFLPSFGHLFLHVLCLYWLLSFINSKKSKFENLKIGEAGTKKAWVIFTATAILFTCFGFYLQYLVQSIIINSDISFDTNTFNATDKFTLLALVIIALIAKILLLSLQLANVIFRKTIRNARVKYFLLFTIALLLLFVYKFTVGKNKLWPSSSEIQIWIDALILLWGIIYIYLTESKYFKAFFAGSNLFSMIFLSVYFSLIWAVYFKFYIDEKEKNITRIAFAEKLSRQQDMDLELKFDEIEARIKKDTVLQDWLLYSDSVSTQEIYKHFKLFNADLYFSKYAQDIFLYDAEGRSLINKETISIDSLRNLKSRSTPTLNQSLFFRMEGSEHGAYLVYLPITKAPNPIPVGYLIVNFKLKQNISQSLYPRLLKNQSDEDSKRDEKYNYAIYINKKLVTQSGSYNFDFTIPSVPTTKFTNYNSDNYSALYYHAAPNIVYLVVYQNNVLVGIITIFSFLFGIFLAIATVENWTSIFSSAWVAGRKVKMIYNASMSVRVKYFALGFTAISFFIIGLSTVVFLTNRYQASSLRTIEENTANVSEAIEDYLQNQKSIISSRPLDEQMINNELAFFLTNIAEQQKIDINIFNPAGQLAFTTQDNIYKSNVLDNNMPAYAFYTLKRKKLLSFTQPETIGRLNYTASYSPIVNHENKMIGYLNIPSFYTQQHLDNQIVSLITTLVNIYTILLLISSIITFLFINTLTKSLRLVADSLKNVSLKNNELINWPYRDEIGLLVNEYNKMVATVEKNARSLVLDERQNAWREMAQQVAHEIKNPLTPMKLNIQYLQQAVNSNHPDIINLTKRVSSSIIEQIDNLNYIASEFSNFAKMPENKTERIEMKSMLERIVLLFSSTKNLKITHSFPEAQVVVFADKSQMLRIFTNIVQNAVESIPLDEREGTVDIQLYFGPGNEEVIIKVSDNGSGIPEEVKDKIFDPYFTTKSSGTGLGLAMTKKIIELWGGTIRFESEQNTGTTFFLTVPLG